MQRHLAPVQRKLGKVLWHHIQILCQRLRCGVEIDKNKTAPALAAHRLQAMRICADVREIPGRRNSVDPAIEMPGPAVERAGKPCAIPRTLTGKNPGPSMRTAIAKRLDSIFAGAHNNDRVGANVIDIGVSNILYMLFAAGPLPRSAPHIAHLAIEEFATGIAAAGNIVIAQKVIAAIQQRLRRSDPVGGKCIRHRRAISPGLPGLMCVVIGHSSFPSNSSQQWTARGT